jgi:hypothetical protein
MDCNSFEVKKPLFHFLNITKIFILFSAAILFQGAPGFGIEIPDCAQLEDWAVKLNDSETVSLAPKAEHKVVVTMWIKDFADYLAEANNRCRRLRQKPVSQLSVDEKQAILFGCKTP